MIFKFFSTNKIQEPIQNAVFLLKLMYTKRGPIEELKEIQHHLRH